VAAGNGKPGETQNETNQESTVQARYASRTVAEVNERRYNWRRRWQAEAAGGGRIQ